MFVKGKSGNPGGRPKSEKEVRAAIQLHGLRMVKALLKIAYNEKHEQQVRALHELFDRGYGKASESIKISGGVTVEERKRVIIERK